MALMVGAFLVLVGGGGLFAQQITTELPPPVGHWVLRAENPVIIGGYGDNFSYDGNNVRPLIGYCLVNLDAANHNGTLEAVVWTTEESGPIYIGKDDPLEGKIRWVQEFRTGSPGLISTFLWLHGDSGYEAPVLPVVWNWLATWGLVKVYVNDELKYEWNVGHFMFTPQTRNQNQAIRKPDGTLYHPMNRDFHGYPQDPNNPILHVVGHSDGPDSGNFPPFTEFMHINFQTVYVISAPAQIGGQ